MVLVLVLLLVLLVLVLLVLALLVLLLPLTHGGYDSFDRKTPGIRRPPSPP